MNQKQLLTKLQQHTASRYRLRSYIEIYLANCLQTNEQPLLITLWCTSKDLESRFATMGLSATSAEHKVMRDFVWCHDMFAQAGFTINHFVFLVGAPINAWQANIETQNIYFALLNDLVSKYQLDVVLEIRPPAVPDFEIIKLITLDNKMIQQEIKRIQSLSASHHRYKLHHSDLEQGIIINEAANATEARDLVREFGNFILIPVEYVERYHFHNLGYRGFADRLLPIVIPYPWRVD